MYTRGYSALWNEHNGVGGGEEEVGYFGGFDIVRRGGECCYISREMTARRLFSRDPIEPIGFGGRRTGPGQSL